MNGNSPRRREARKGKLFAPLAALRFLCLLTIGSSPCRAQATWSVPLNPDVPLVKQIRLPSDSGVRVELTSVLKGVFLKAGAKEDPTPKPVRVLIAPPQPAYVVPIVVKLRTRESEATNPAEAAKAATAQAATLPGTNLPAVFVAPVDISSLTRSASLVPVVDQKGALYLERLRQGDNSPEVFDYLKQLSFTEIVKLIEAVSVWQSTEDKRLLRALAKALIDHHGISDEKTTGLPNAAVLALADYYKDQSSERCVKLYEGLLAKRKTKADGFVPELNGLAEYYRKVNNHVKAAETYLRAESYSADKPFLANFTIEAARDYMRAGDEKKANELYEGVEKYGYGWATGMASIDRARVMVERGETHDAKALLTRIWEGQHGEIRVIAGVYLASALVKLGEIAAARRMLSAALKLGSDLGSKVEQGATFLRMALDCSSWLDRFEQMPIFSETAKWTVQLHDLGGPVFPRLPFYSRTRMLVKATCSIPGLIPVVEQNKYEGPQFCQCWIVLLPGKALPIRETSGVIRLRADDCGKEVGTEILVDFK